MLFPMLIGGGGGMWDMYIKQQIGFTQDSQNQGPTDIQKQDMHGTIGQTKPEGNRARQNIVTYSWWEASETKNR